MATKIGVYFDQSAIGGGLDIEALAAGVEKRWSDLAPVVKVFPMLAAEEARKEIAADIGTAREVVSRRLAAFAKAGLVRTERGSVTPLDMDGLRRIKDGSAAP